MPRRPSPAFTDPSNKHETEMMLRRPALALSLLMVSCLCTATAAPFELQLRSRTAETDGWLAIHTRPAQWDPSQTAIIVCDMWDSHHCLNAVRRVRELAPRIDALLQAARREGATIIHAPSSCVEFYRDHPARQRAVSVPRAATLPEKIEQWCDWRDGHEQQVGYPIDHSDGGEDDDPAEHEQWRQQLAALGRNPAAPWVRQIETIGIHDQDYITDDGVENWSILQHHGIQHVMLVGVHTNMCVLGRPFGLRQLARNGLDVALVRDLTDTMYNPAMPPYVSHFSGTDLIVEHIEQHVCPTITSDQLLGGTPHRFQLDRRPHLVMLIGEDEYETRVTLPAFARRHLYRDFRVSYCFADEQQINDFHDTELIPTADLLLVSVRRRTPPAAQLQRIRDHVAAGKPVVGIRTASHAFAFRSDQTPPPDHAAWPEFDAEVLGGNYQGHHNNKGSDDEASFVWREAAVQSPLVAELAPAAEYRTTSWLYKTSPLRPGAAVLMMGRVGDRQPHEPVTWTYVHSGQGRTFYTSLGHPDDFADPRFTQLLRKGVYWALQLQPTASNASVNKQITD